MDHPAQAELVLALCNLKAERCKVTVIGHFHTSATEPCDCPAGYVHRPAERSGCPELASAAVLLASLTPWEYAELVSRSSGAAPQPTTLGTTAQWEPPGELGAELVTDAAGELVDGAQRLLGAGAGAAPNGQAPPPARNGDHKAPKRAPVGKLGKAKPTSS